MNTEGTEPPESRPCAVCGFMTDASPPLCSIACRRNARRHTMTGHVSDYTPILKTYNHGRGRENVGGFQKSHSIDTQER